MRKIVFDLDGTLCSLKAEGTHWREYSKVQPITYLIEALNGLYDSGEWNVTIHTARGMSSLGEIDHSWDELKRLTVDWLKKYDVKYHELIFRKPPADVYVCDKSMTPEDFVKNLENFI